MVAAAQKGGALSRLLSGHQASLVAYLRSNHQVWPLVRNHSTPPGNATPAKVPATMR
jgi:hypothetical protein